MIDPSFTKVPFFEVRLMDLDGGNSRVLVPAKPEVKWIMIHDWSPDNKWLAVQLGKVDNTAQIGLVSTTDGAIRVLKSSHFQYATRLAFSPDGKHLAYDFPVDSNLHQKEIRVM